MNLPQVHIHVTYTSQLNKPHIFEVEDVFHAFQLGHVSISKACLTSALRYPDLLKKETDYITFLDTQINRCYGNCTIDKYTVFGHLSATYQIVHL